MDFSVTKKNKKRQEKLEFIKKRNGLFLDL